MPNLPLHPATAPALEADLETRAAYALAARAVLAGKHNRPTLRVTRARLRPEVQLDFADHVHADALRVNRAFLEETVMVTLAGHAAQTIKYGEAQDGQGVPRARDLLLNAAQNDDEREAADAYLTVLLARARGVLRRCWAEVEVVALALLERGVLDGVEIEHRVHCVQGIRSATLN